MDPVVARYRIPASRTEAEQIGRDIALEQTVEIPAELAARLELSHDRIGMVRDVTPAAADSSNCWDVVIEYPADFASGGLGQLCNLLFGNISLKPEIRLTEVALPEKVLKRYPGPQVGIDGLRNELGVFGRPLLATALKPRGATANQLAGWAADFARGGGDLVKDDHNLVEADSDAFLDRVKKCLDALAVVEQTCGRRTAYLPNLAGPPDQLEYRIETCLRWGVTGFLIAPMLLGLDTLEQLTRQYRAFWWAHPTFAGGHVCGERHGIDPGWFLGTLPRLIGCDGTIFPNQGGRFTFSAHTCHTISHHAREPMSHIAPCWPSPAGGMSFERLPAMAGAYQQDAIFLIGGALLGDPSGLETATRRYRGALDELFPENRQQSPAPFLSACELPSRDGRPTQNPDEYLPFLEGFRWDGRPPTDYKISGALPFQAVSRTELIGRNGEETAFDLRYFEIEPGGYSSLERHRHTHVIIGTRGEGRLLVNEGERAIRPFDVAYVPPLKVHQLRNDGPQPFGFFCIVDRDRDRPQAP